MSNFPDITQKELDSESLELESTVNAFKSALRKNTVEAFVEFSKLVPIKNRNAFTDSIRKDFEVRCLLAKEFPKKFPLYDR